MENGHSSYPVVLSPEDMPKFVNEIPHPERVNLTKKDKEIKINLKETLQWLGLVDEHGTKIYTAVWGYQSPISKATTYPGPTLITKKNHRVYVRWQNKLPDHHLVAVDKSIHAAAPEHNGVPTVTHLHGGHTEPDSDGFPDAWFTYNFTDRGPAFVKRTYRYDNTQQAATLWYHDHALGFTRTNVYSGLAGFYLLRDNNELDLIEKHILPSGKYELEVVVQDRDFTQYGDLFFPSTNPELPPDAPNPSILPEFFGNYILVNGMTWPVFNVEPTKYRIRLLNGSDSRFYIFRFDNDMSFMQIGTDDGFLEKPIVLNQLLLAPAERADLIIDFSYHKCSNIVLKNYGPDEPFKGFNTDGSLSDGEEGTLDPANPQTTGIIMMFKVSEHTKCNAKINKHTHLVCPRKPLVPTVPIRQLVLFEGEDKYGRIRPILGTFNDGSLLWDQPVTEIIKYNSVEMWEVFNTTADAHPIHIHSISFRAVNRQEFDGEAIVDGTDPDGGTKQRFVFNGFVGPIIPVSQNELGPKDTIIMLPGQATRIIAKYDNAGKFVWHCHIISHEDNEMMRPLEVIKQ
jgi:spore coat protein A